MAKMERKSFDKPEETRSINKRKIDVLKLGDVTAMRVRFEPGWKWSECVKPIAGTESCQVSHLMHMVSGRTPVRMDDGTEADFGAGDVGVIPPVERRREGAQTADTWSRNIHRGLGVDRLLSRTGIAGSGLGITRRDYICASDACGTMVGNALRFRRLETL